MLLDVAAIAAQASALVMWPLVEGRYVLYMIPVSSLHFRWMKDSPYHFISTLAKGRKKELKNKTYFMYAILAPWKSAHNQYYREYDDIQIMLQNYKNRTMVGDSDANLGEAIANGFGTITETSIWTPLSVWLINIMATYICYAFGKFACKIMIQTF
ncbi:hypothetical protein NQ317_019736 [Molorchus minor]|uniref:Uncharacterized protein n=1 Tax=Molorchus minor TaxID=1323400 RepID=A0ABQ9ITG5_9CUCU|nr:hypothetical protein NQ317_019736 [Molorchus minor]